MKEKVNFVVGMATSCVTGYAFGRILRNVCNEIPGPAGVVCKIGVALAGMYLAEKVSGYTVQLAETTEAVIIDIKELVNHDFIEVEPIESSRESE